MKASSASLHGHDKSLHVSFSLEEVAILAKEIYDDTVAEVTFSLFTYWVCGSRENYEQAKLHIRELGLDQVSASLLRVTACKSSMSWPTQEDSLEIPLFLHRSSEVD